MCRASLIKSNIHTILRGLCCGLLLVAPQLVLAVGTPSGTTISNTSTLMFAIGAGAPSSVTSNTVSFLVDKKVNLIVAEISGSPTSVNKGQTGAVTRFSVTNLGNDLQGFKLATALATANPAGPPPFATNDFSATGLAAYADINNNGIYEPLIDTATSIPSLAAGASKNVFIVGDIPANVLNGQQSVVSLEAIAVTPVTMATLVATAGPNTSGVDIVFADNAGVAAGDIARDARHSAYAAYLAGGLDLILSKSVIRVQDPNGTTTLMPAAIITYQIVATLAGSGTAANLVITDPMPANTTYVAQSIVVNGITKTDAADADNAQFITASQTISISLGNVASPANAVITFRATIN
jgi:uncharacterized repeat protein (TIGR01451 family)